jgi:hypothetical protein
MDLMDCQSLQRALACFIISMAFVEIAQAFLLLLIWLTPLFLPKNAPPNLKLHPVAFGKGIPLFSKRAEEIRLAMNNASIYPNGVMHLHYTIRYQF